MKVVVSGYYGYGNAGDEAVLAGLLRALAAHGIGAVVISGDPAGTETLHGVEAVGRGAPRKVARALRQADLLVSGGGGLIQDRTSRRSALYYLGVIGWARALGVEAYLYAQGVGPVTTRTVRAAARLVLPSVLGAGARDEASAKELVRLGVPAGKVRVTADAAFALPPSDREEAERALRAAGIAAGGPKLGLVWRPPAPGRRRTAGPGNHGALLRAVAFAAGEWAKKTGGSVAVIPLHPAHDLAACRFLAQETAREGGRAHVVAQARDYRSLRAVVAGLDLVLSVRYHGLLFAAAAGIPCAGVAYDPKVAALAKELGAEALPLTAGVAAVRETLFRVWEEREELAAHLVEKTATLRQRALAEGARLREIIERAGA